MEGSHPGTHPKVCTLSRLYVWESGNPHPPLSHRFSPSNHVHKWSTPELIIHGSKDYRLPETDGIAAFHALQQCVPTSFRCYPGAGFTEKVIGMTLGEAFQVAW